MPHWSRSVTLPMSRLLLKASAPSLLSLNDADREIDDVVRLEQKSLRVQEHAELTTADPCLDSFVRPAEPDQEPAQKL